MMKLMQFSFQYFDLKCNTIIYMHGNWIIQWRILIMVIVTIASSILAGWKYTLFLFLT